MSEAAPIGRPRSATESIDDAIARCRATLGRIPADRFEAAVVLEAFHGMAAAEALRLGAAVITSLRSDDVRAVATVESVVVVADTEARNRLFLGEMAFVASVLLVGFWISRLSHDFGNDAVERGWRSALPITLGLQWVLRRRYLAGDDSLGRLRREPAALAAALVFAAVVGLVVGGSLGGILATLWTAGFVIARRGWWLPQLVVLLGAIAIQTMLGHPLVVLLSCTFIALAAAVRALLTTEKTDRQPGPWITAMWAGLLGAGLGALLVVEPEFIWADSLGSSSHKVPPFLSMLTVVPSLLGSLWGAHRMASLWDRLPRELLERRVSARSATAGSGSVTTLFLGSLLRIAVCCVGLSSMLVAWVVLSDLPVGITVRLLVAHAVLGVAGLCVSLLEAFGRAGRALSCVVGGVALALALPLIWTDPPAALRILTAALCTAILSTILVLRLVREPARTIVLGV